MALKSSHNSFPKNLRQYIQERPARLDTETRISCLTYILLAFNSSAYVKESQIVMANMATPMRLSGLARRLVNEGLLNEEQALSAQSAAKEAKQPLLPTLLITKFWAALILPRSPRRNSVCRCLISNR